MSTVSHNPQPATEPTPASTSTPSSARRPWWHWRSLQWVLVPLVVFGAAEMTYRHFRYVRSWYPEALPVIAKTQPETLIVCAGSSRVAHALDPAVLQEALASEGMPYEAAYNLAAGYTTLAEHVLGVQRIIDARGTGEGLLVVFEAPDGLSSGDRWHRRWYQPPAPQFLSRLLRWQDLPAFWRTESTADEKLRMVFQKLGRHVAVIDSRHVLQDFVSGPAWAMWAEQIHASFEPAPAPTPGTSPVLKPTPRPSVESMGNEAVVTKPSGDEQANVDLDHAGGVRVDPATVEKVRAATRKRYAEMAKIKQWPMKFEPGVVIVDWVDRLQAQGAEVVIIVTPTPTARQALYATQQRQEDVALFKRVMAEHGVPVLWPDFEYTDDDLPDLMHLAASQRGAFTRAVAEAIADSQRDGDSAKPTP